MGAFAKEAGQANDLLKRPSSVVPDPVVYDLPGDPGAAEGVHSKRVDGLTAQAGGAVAWVEEFKAELHL